jgi:hypothetical protein
MSTRSNSGSIVGGLILILLGLLFLFGQWFQSFDFLGRLWPLFIVGFGALFFIGMLAGGKSAAGLAVPGSIITVVGLMLLAQSLTGYWESWSYGWTLILISVGLGIFIMGVYDGNNRSRQAGLRVMRIGAFFLIVFGALFEGIFFASQHPGVYLGLIFPALLILLGLYLVLIRSNGRRGSTQPGRDSQEKPS